MCKNAGCKEKAVGLSEFCWDHIHDKDGYRASILDAVRRGSDLAGCNFRKVLLANSRLEGARFSGVDLSQADLSGSHLFDARLDGADLIGTGLSGCELTNCDLSGADLTKASLAHSRLWNATLRGANLTESDLSGADLWNAHLFDVKLWHTLFHSCKFLTMRSFSRHAHLISSSRINEGGLASAEEAYRGLKQYFMNNGMYNDASWAAYKEKTIERLILKKNRDLNYFPSLMMGLLCGYGERQGRIVLAAVVTILLYAVLYGLFGVMKNSWDPLYVLSWADCIYVSTVTFTTVGYGDFVPKNPALFKFIAASEAFMGVFLSGLFIFTLGRKYTGR